MPEDINILIKAILDESKETRQDIKDMNAKMATKEDLKEQTNFLRSQIDDVKKHLNDQDKELVGVKYESQKNTDFRVAIMERTKWFLGVVVVAVLGVFSSVVVSAAHVTTPTVISAPHVVVQPVIKTVVPPQPDNAQKH